MKKILLAGFVSFASVGFIACNGDYDANPNTNNGSVTNPLNNNGNNGNVSALTTGSWIVSAYTVTTPSGTVDMLPLVDECEKDNITTFNTDNTMTIDEGAMKCSPTDPQTKNDQTWAMSGNQLTITSPEGPTPWDVVTLDNSTLKISRTFTYNNITTTATQTYARP